MKRLLDWLAVAGVSVCVGCGGGGSGLEASATPEAQASALPNTESGTASGSDSDADGTSDNTGDPSGDNKLSGTTSTDGVLCDYSDVTFNTQPSLTYTSESEWSCASNRVLSANGIPDHEVGTFPNASNPNTISEQRVNASFSLTPALATVSTTLGGPRGPVGYVLNGVKIDAATAGACDDSGNACSLAGNASGSWEIEALSQSHFDFGVDFNNAHVQPDGSYHYHGMPEGFLDKLGADQTSMTLIGWATDGFPIYARYGYADPEDASSAVVVMEGSYQLVSIVPSHRPPTDVYDLGTFSDDWEYVEGSGDLDECNGRFGVTPEFPAGIYHYFATDSYPFFQRCVRGAL